MRPALDNSATQHDELFNRNRPLSGDPGGYCGSAATRRACSGRKGADTDLQAGDADEAQRLLTQADTGGVAPLPPLTAAELWVLCGTAQVLADEAEFGWWSRKTEDQRRAMAASIPDLLRERSLVRPTDATWEAVVPARLPMTPALAMIVAARQGPSVVAVGIRADGSSNGTPRMFGLAYDGQPLRAVVGEYIADPMAKPYGAVLGPEHKFSLLSPGRAGHVLAVWAATSGRRLGVRGRVSGSRSGRTRVISVFRHQDGQMQTCERVSVAGASEPFDVSRERTGAEPQLATPCTRDELARLLTQILTAGSQ